MKKLTRFITVLGLTVVLSTSFLVDDAHASWGAAKLLQQNTGVTTPTSPTTPPPTTPTTNWWSRPPVTTPVPAEPTVEQGSMTQNEALMLNLINGERAKVGLKPLQPMAKLNELARLKSQDIADKDYFSHISPTYGSFANMVYDAGIRFRSVGENLAMARNAQHAFVLLMASSGHKANILNPNFTHIGLGVIQDTYGVVVTQLFIMQ